MENIKQILLEPKKTWIPLIAVIGLLIPAYWLGSSVSDINNNVRALDDKMARLEKSMDDYKVSNTDIMKTVMNHENRITLLEQTCLKK